MSGGPEERQPVEESQAEKPALPGDFVSEDLRSDCARFLDELERLVRVRSESAARRQGRPG